MPDEVKAVKTLDLRGLLCPLPIVKVSQAIKQVKVGEDIEAVASDPGVQKDIPAWCKTSGNELVKMDHSGKEFHFVVRRLK
jgi:tRNA 2-thiouridine synthesizing protein A